MKKSLLIFILVFVLSASIFGADRVDMIVLLDNSVSVLPYYDNIQNSLIKRIISEHLKPGDTFSLIAFADYPEVEISREIKNENDIREILAYSALLQPMGNYTDLVLSLRFLYKYSLDLPLSNRKKIIILTDGIHDPPPESPYYLTDPEAVQAAVKKAAEDIHREGWDISIVELEDSTLSDTGIMPENTDGKTDLSSDGGIKTDVIDTVSDTLGSKPNTFRNDGSDMAGIALGIPMVGVPEHLGNTTGELTVPLSIKNRGNKVLLFSLSAVLADGIDILKEKASVKLDPDETDVLDIELKFPSELEPGEYTQEVSLRLVGGLNTEPRSLNINFTLVEKGHLNRGLDFLFDWRVIAVIAGIIIAIIIIVIIKRSSSDTGTSEGHYKTDKDEEESVTAVNTAEIQEPKDSRHEPEEYLFASMSVDSEDEIPHRKNRPVQMLVYGQNTKLGITNVKWLGLNKKRTIGSSTSSIFRIFFIKVPPVIANIECTGDDFVFTPVRNEYFPEVNEPLHNCLNRKIKIVNENNKLFYIEFRQWVSELEKVNRLLSMTKHRGTPDLEY